VFHRLLKKLDLLIIKAFIGPFVATFFVTLFVLVLQFMWLYIDDMVGKGLDTLTIAQLILYLSATLVPLALPLAVLLSSIMTLGNLGETYELVAIKSAGISLLRFMRPLFIVTIGITLVAFYFNNSILPIANLRMNTIKYDIIVTKPAFAIKEGVFYDKIEGYVIKIGKKEKDDSTIRNVVIYEQNQSGVQDDIIVAEKGKMIVTPDKKSLEFVLQNGTLYREKADRTNIGSNFVRMSFKEYKKILDLSSFKMNKTDDSAFRNNYQMLTLVQLSRNIDSLEKANALRRQHAANDLRNILKFPAFLDTTGWDAAATPVPQNKHTDTGKNTISGTSGKSTSIAVQPASHIPNGAAPNTSGKSTSVAAHTAPIIRPNRNVYDTFLLAEQTARDSLSKAWTAAKASKDSTIRTRARALSKAPEPVLADLLPDSTRIAVLDRTIAVVNSAKVNLDQPALLYTNEENNLRQHEIAWHEKITLAVACLVMFLIGAPLGSIIRKGGIGLPLVFAVVFFVIFFLLNNFGKKFVKEDVLTPIGGMWMATYVLTPIGLFFIYKALNDSQLFNKEAWFRMGSTLREFIKKKKAPAEEV
jgi:lipopolysaccharide export system permease protein